MLLDSLLNDFSKLVLKTNSYLESKRELYELVETSYIGGLNYYSRKNLFRYFRESLQEYKSRLERSVNFNFVKEISDSLNGLLYINKPEKKIQKELESFYQNCFKDVTFEEILKSISLYSSLFLCGVLIYQDEIDSSKIITKADEKLLPEPKIKLFKYSDIVNFRFDENNQLDWVILKESVQDIIGLNALDDYEIYYYYDKEKIYTYKKIKGAFERIKEQKNNLEKIPFVFSSLDFNVFPELTDSYLEEIALLSRKVYNKLSEWDSKLSSTSFDILFYPTQDGEALPKELKENILDISAISFNANYSQKPFFDSPKNSGNGQEYEKFIDKIINQIKISVGLDNETDKTFAQSGYAKSLEFIKTKSILTRQLSNIESIEKRIIEFVCEFKKIKNTSEIKYNANFDSPEIQKELENLSIALNNFRDNKEISDILKLEMIKKLLPEKKESELEKVIKENEIIQDNTSEEI